VIYPFTESPLPVDFETADGVFKAYRLLKERVGTDTYQKKKRSLWPRSLAN